MERRDFLKTSGVLAATGAAASFSSAFAMGRNTQTIAPAKRKFGYAVLGLGKYATEVILPNFNTSEDSELVALISGDRKKAEFYAKKYHIDPSCVYTYDTMEQIKNNPAIDAVYIITPNSTHRHFATLAFQCGKHVMCEKPLATTVEDCLAMGKAAEAAGKELIVGYRVHFDPLTCEVIKNLKAGAAGDVQLIQTANMENQLPDRDKPYLKWRLTRSMAGSGSLGDIGIYGLNASRYLSNMEPVMVSGKELFRAGDVDGAMSWTLYYPNGAVAQGASSFGSNTLNRFAVVGSKTSIELLPGSSYYNNRATILSNGNGQDRLLEQPYFRKQTATQWGKQLDALPASIASKKPSVATWQEGMRDVQIINAIVESAAHDGRKIDVSNGSDWAQKVYGKDGLWSAM